MLNGRCRVIAFLIFWLTATLGFSVEPCPTLTITPVVPGTNMFNPQQEVDLGEAIAASLTQSFRVIPDPATVESLQSITNRLLQQLPEGNQISSRVYIFDSPTVEAFSIPGRIYVSRKLIAMTRNEDEMAGVLAHELGHMAAHHGAIQMSEQFRTVLRVTQVGDQSDITGKWNEYLNNYRRQHLSARDISKEIKLEEREQVQADNIALYVMSRAGYSSQAFVDFFDRLAETKGNTGNFWSGLFGNTKPDSKRLREMIKNRAPLPASCAMQTKNSLADYAAWRNAVVAYTLTYQESLPGLVSKMVLKERLRSDIRHLHISPDGKYILAQDESNIFVLTRAPLKPLFRVDASGASGAQFSPDSRSIVFQVAPIESSPRVERWDIETQKRQDSMKFMCAAVASTPRCRRTAASWAA